MFLSAVPTALVVPRSCRFGGTRGDELCALCPGHLSGAERLTEASPGCCLLCTTVSVRAGMWCSGTWGEEGKVPGQPCLQRAQGLCDVSAARLHAS